MTVYPTQDPIVCYLEFSRNSRGISLTRRYQWEIAHSTGIMTGRKQNVGLTTTEVTDMAGTFAAILT